MAEEIETKVTVDDQQNEEEATEISPLTSKDETIKESKEKINKKQKQKSLPERVQALIELIQNNEKNKKAATTIAGCLLIIILLLLITIIWVLVTRDPLIDPNYRYLRLIPRNNQPKNTIRFSVGEYGSWKSLKNQIDIFLQDYNNTRIFMQDKIKFIRMDCNEITITSSFNRSCYFNADEIFSLCQSRNNYGYSEGSPCVFLKFNNIKGWVPDVIRDQSHALQMPTQLMRLYNSGYTGPFVDCQPNTAVDRENLGGQLRYAPGNQEMPARFFPYLNQPNYMSPFVAIKFDRPARNIYIGITCRLWAANLTGAVEGYWYRPSAVLPFHIFIE